MIEKCQTILNELSAIRVEMVAAASQSQSRIDLVHANYRESACNLLHYLALRRHDLRSLQMRLAELGLSSLGRAEPHVLATVDAVLEVLRHLTGSATQASSPEADAVNSVNGKRLLARHTKALLGPATPGRCVRVMVTMPSAAADDGAIIHDLLQGGMDCMRINCAHDSAAHWLRMIEHLRRAELALTRSCTVVMDLAGPKLRTGPLEPGPAVIKIRPHRNILGHVIAPARVWLTSKETPHSPPSAADACLPMPKSWLEGLNPGDQVKCTDARGSKRIFTVADVTAGGCWAEVVKTTYIVPGILLRHTHGAHSDEDREAAVGDLPFTENAIALKPKDLLILTRNLNPGRPANPRSVRHAATPAQVGCTIPAVFDDVRVGEPIWFDDGKIGGVVEKVHSTRVHVRITHTRLRGGKLRGGKGINLPESQLRLAALTTKDLEDLAFVAQHADVVDLSFANSAGDVESLHPHLAALGGRLPALVLKIETRRGFENLTDMLLTAMRSPCCGVMIARGDLAVECGFERLAEVQEQILWICEAAHVPVIWATQVLETLAKEGMASRAEITDAAMGNRAECVMLNKGPYLLSALRVLDDILRRMQTHQTKKRTRLRELRVAHLLPVL